MNVTLLVIDMHLEGCTSLKEKRQCLRGITDRWGKSAQVAVCESAYQDSLKQAQWSFVIAASDARLVQQVLAKVEEDLLQSVDAVVTGRHQERLI